MIRFIQWCTCALAACFAYGIAASIAGFSMPPTTRLGHRGAVRQLTLVSNQLFSTVDPAIRLVGALIAQLPVNKLRLRCDVQLQRARYWLGLTADEFLALSIISAAAMAAVGEAIGLYIDRGHFLLVPGLLLGGLLPVTQIQEIIRKRAKEVSRRLPRAIEIAALCMGAGLDFTGALRFLSQSRGDKQDALAEEFSAILDELNLGHTRREALRGFADRVSSRAVHDFVNAVIQAEQRGNPLAKVIQVQGRMLSMHRSILAEESAARAGVLMIMPMMLLLGCILLFLMGPFIVKGVGF